MQMRVLATAILALPILLIAAISAQADDIAAACQEPGWEMSREILAFRDVGTPMEAGTDAQAAPAIQIGRVYALRLKPQGSVKFARTPQKFSQQEGAVAGMARVAVTSSGKYRITADAPLWIDIIAPSGTLQANEFNGWHQCGLFRKSLVYSLSAGQPLVLQLSGGSAPVVKVAIEPL
jgi:hypothetical protein